MAKKAFRSFEKGFHMRFANGYTVSVQWRDGCYCGDGEAEVGVWDATGKWFDLTESQVEGWCTPDRVATIIAQVVALPDSN